MTGPVANADMMAAWDGEEGQRWVAWAEHYESGSARFRHLLVEAAAVAPTDEVIDIGCGLGGTTLDVARLASRGRALGVDLSGPMLGRARGLAETQGLANVTFEQADAQVHPFERGAFDAAISSFGCMFFADPVAAFTNIGSTLRPGGRLAMLSWRAFDENPWMTALFTALKGDREIPTPPPDSPGPFGLANPDYVRKVLSSAGFIDVDLTPLDEPMLLGRDADAAFTYASQGVGITKGLLEGVSDDERAAALGRVRAAVDNAAASSRPEWGPGVWMPAGAWLATARR